MADPFLLRYDDCPRSVESGLSVAAPLDIDRDVVSRPLLGPDADDEVAYFLS